MTQEQVVQQVLGRVKMEESQVGIAQNVLQLWVANFPSKYMFGHREVLWGERLVRRELATRWVRLE
jgi:hypothetical protein